MCKKIIKLDIRTQKACINGKNIAFLNGKPQNYKDVNSPQITYAFIIPIKIPK